MNMPSDLGAEGRRTWREITHDYIVQGNELALAELCRTADRLAQVRMEIVGAAGKDLASLVSSECKLAATWARLWRILGIPVAEIPTRGGKRDAKK